MYMVFIYMKTIYMVYFIYTFQRVEKKVKVRLFRGIFLTKGDPHMQDGKV